VWSLSALERYQDCPFKFFAADVLDLEEAAEDGATLSPRVRGRLVHEVLHRFFAAWDARGGGALTAARLSEARTLFVEVAEPLLASLPAAEAALERARLFGSPVSIGVVDTLLAVEIARPAAASERWLEYRLEGAFSLGTQRPQVRLRGVADRIDLLPGRRLRVIDYKTGTPAHPKRALQVPVYALCARERLEQRDRAPWTVVGAEYVRLSGRRHVLPVVEAAETAEQVLAAARDRLDAVLAGVAAGHFPPRPHDPVMCGSCAYSSVCRKDYVE
jgi:RecB family exonuclease